MIGATTLDEPGGLPMPDERTQGSHMDNHYIFKAEVEEVVRPDELILDLDLGFGIRKQTVVSLFGVDSPDPVGEPDDSAEARRGEQQVEFVEDWIRWSRETWDDDDCPFSVTTIRPRDGSRQKYAALVFSRETTDCLNDYILTEYPENSDL